MRDRLSKLVKRAVSTGDRPTGKSVPQKDGLFQQALDALGPTGDNVVVIAKELQELLDREPFEPFRIRLSSGDTYEIRNPALTITMRSRLFIAFPGTDRWTLIPFLHITAVEALGNGHGRKPRRRKP